MYFSKKNMDNIENKIYKHLLIWSILDLITYLFGLYTINIFDVSRTLYNEFLVILSSKLNGCAMVVWNTFFISYILIVNRENIKQKKLSIKDLYTRILL